MIIAWRMPFLMILGNWLYAQYPVFQGNVSFAIIFLFGGLICTFYDLGEISGHAKTPSG